jgi:branched-chain amino acid transport system substrate-binding protein
MLRFARLKKYQRVALISTIDTSGRAAESATLEDLRLPEFGGLQLVAQEHFSAGDINAAAQIARMKAAQADVTIVWAAGLAFGTIMRSMNDAGWDIPVITTAANLNRTELEQFGRFLPTNVYFNSFAYAARDILPAGVLRNKIDEFYAAFRDAGARPTPGSGFAWDPLLILMAAFQKLGTDVTPARLRDYLVNLHDFVGISGVYDFRTGDQHGLTDASVTLVQWDPKTHEFSIATKLGGIPLH